MSEGKKIHVKVCGMRDAENIRSVAALGPDYLGFIFYPTSPRYVGDGFSMPRDLPVSVKKVGVFVNAVVDEMMKYVAVHGLDIVQLHGGESPETARALRNAGIHVWKVFSVDSAFDFSETERFEDVADLFLFDTKGKLHGGNAAVFDWNVLAKYNQRVPFMLSGGITSGNLSGISVLEGMNLHGIDINSGAERSPGLKDLEKVRQIAAIVESFK